MKKLTEILPDLFVVEVPEDAYGFDIGRNNGRALIYHSGGYEVDNRRTGYYQLPGREWQYLGYATKDEISFDTRGIVDRFNNGAWRDYADKTFAPDQDSPNFFLTSKESFRSLLLKHGLYWVNPLGEEEPLKYTPDEGSDYVPLHTKWEQYETNRLTGKLVVIKKVK